MGKQITDITYINISSLSVSSLCSQKLDIYQSVNVNSYRTDFRAGRTHNGSFVQVATSQDEGHLVHITSVITRVRPVPHYHRQACCSVTTHLSHKHITSVVTRVRPVPHYHRQACCSITTHLSHKHIASVVTWVDLFPTITDRPVAVSQLTCHTNTQPLW